MQVAAPWARHIQIGQLGGLTAELPAPTLRSAPLDVRGFAVFHHSIQARREGYAALAQHVLDGHIGVDVEAVPLSDIGAAWERQRAGANAKLVVTP
jgi:hypothetical protein